MNVSCLPPMFVNHEPPVCDQTITPLAVVSVLNLSLLWLWRLKGHKNERCHKHPCGTFRFCVPQPLLAEPLKVPIKTKLAIPSHIIFWASNWHWSAFSCSFHTLNPASSDLVRALRFVLRIGDEVLHSLPSDLQRGGGGGRGVK